MRSVLLLLLFGTAATARRSAITLQFVFFRDIASKCSQSVVASADHGGAGAQVELLARRVPSSVRVVIEAIIDFFLFWPLGLGDIVFLLFTLSLALSR